MHRLPPNPPPACFFKRCLLLQPHPFQPTRTTTTPSPPTPLQLVFLKVASSCSHTLSNQQQQQRQQQQQQQQQKTLCLEGVSLQEEPGCIGSGVTRCLSVLVSLFLVFMLVLEGVWLKRCKNIQCIWGGGAAPSPQPPSSLFFLGCLLLQPHPEDRAQPTRTTTTTTTTPQASTTQTQKRIALASWHGTPLHMERRR